MIVELALTLALRQPEISATVRELEQIEQQLATTYKAGDCARRLTMSITTNFPAANQGLSTDYTDYTDAKDARTTPGEARCRGSCRHGLLRRSGPCSSV